MFKTIILLYFALLGANQCFADTVIVSLPKGDIRGHEIAGVNNSSFYAFQQIPYAAPPVGSLRFQPPVEPEPWDDVLNTTENTKVCYQYRTSGSERESEDCLYLNVYTPIRPENITANKSVLVFFHGGHFEGGSGTIDEYGPHYFVNQDLVVVTANYRLGPFGFLSTQDLVIPGNQGLKDQLLALKWVNQNIQLFGGDPDQVTISGQSAGAVMTSYHIVSEKSAGLFRSAIVESGSAICPFGYQPLARRVAYLFAQGIDPNFTENNSSAELLELLQNVPAVEINQYDILNEFFGLQMGQGDLLTPVAEPEHDGAFITGLMHERFKNGSFNIVPTLIGFTSAEQLMEAANVDSFKATMAEYDANLTLAVNLDFKVAEENREIFGRKLRKLYTSNGLLCSNELFQEDLPASVQFISDAKFTTGVIREAYLQSNYTDVYLYQFSYSGALGVSVNISGDNAPHASELQYLWYKDNIDFSTLPEADQLVQNRILTLFSNFVKYSNPTPEADDLFQNTIWPTTKQDNLQYLNINGTLEVLVDPKKYRSWVALVDEYGNPPFDTY